MEQDRRLENGQDLGVRSGSLQGPRHVVGHALGHRSEDLGLPEAAVVHEADLAEGREAIEGSDLSTSDRTRQGAGEGLGYQRVAPGRVDQAAEGLEAPSLHVDGAQQRAVVQATEMDHLVAEAVSVFEKPQAAVGELADGTSLRVPWSVAACRPELGAKNNKFSKLFARFGSPLPRAARGAAVERSWWLGAFKQWIVPVQRSDFLRIVRV